MSSVVPRECKRLRAWLPQYAEERLSDRPRAAVEQHLVGCARCTQEVADLRAVISTARSIPAEVMPGHLVPQVRQAVARQVAARRGQPSPAPRPFWSRIAIPAAAATGLLAVVLGYRIVEQGYAPRSLGGAMQAERAAQQAAPAAPATRRPATSQAPRREIRRTLREGTATGSQSRPATPMPRSSAQDQAAKAAAKPTAPPSAELGFADQTRSLQAPTAPSPQVREQATPKGEAAVGAPASAVAGGGGGGARGGGAAASRHYADGRLGAARARETGAKRKSPPNAAAIAPNRSGGARSGRQGRGGAGPSLPVAARRERKRAAPAPAQEEVRARSRAPQPATAQAVLTRHGDKLAVAVKLETSSPGEAVQVQAGEQEVWRGALTEEAHVVVSVEETGGGQQTTPLTITSPSGSRSYTLFVPPFAQLGRQSGAARRRYQGVPLAKVLSEMSARAGLVLLVEGPLDREVTGELALDQPRAAVETIAKYAGYAVRSDDLLVYTLTPRQ